jgi:hypothetical protein
LQRGQAGSMNKHKYSSVGRGHPVGAGSQGPAGPRGEPAPTIAAWEPRPERFEIVPRFSNGESCPPLNLLSCFKRTTTQRRGSRTLISNKRRRRHERPCTETENGWSREIGASDRGLIGGFDMLAPRHRLRKRPDRASPAHRLIGRISHWHETEPRNAPWPGDLHLISDRRLRSERVP